MRAGVGRARAVGARGAAVFGPLRAAGYFWEGVRVCGGVSTCWLRRPNPGQGFGLVRQARSGGGWVWVGWAGAGLVTRSGMERETREITPGPQSSTFRSRMSTSGRPADAGLCLVGAEDDNMWMIWDWGGVRGRGLLGMWR